MLYIRLNLVPLRANADIYCFLQLWRRATAFVRLLAYGGPSFADMSILLTGFVASIASGVPFPIMSIVFGQLVNGLNSATCEVSEADASKHQG